MSTNTVIMSKNGQTAEIVNDPKQIKIWENNGWRSVGKINLNNETPVKQPTNNTEAPEKKNTKKKSR